MDSLQFSFYTFYNFFLQFAKVMEAEFTCAETDENSAAWTTTQQENPM